MDDKSPLTTGQLGKLFPSVPGWKLRRTVDSLGVPIPRIGLYRVIPRELIGPIAAKLQAEGWLAPKAEVPAR